MKTYLFDVKLNAALRVKANSRAEAVTKLRDMLDCAEANFGAIDGDPLTGEVSLAAPPQLVEKGE